MKRDGRRAKRIELTEEHVKLIETLAGLGLTQAQIAECLPIAERTLAERIAGGDEAIAAAYARGRAKDLADMSQRHRDIARGGEGIPVGEQRRALQWRMERQHKWAERVEHTGPDGAAIRVDMQELSAEQLKRIAAGEAVADVIAGGTG